MKVFISIVFLLVSTPAFSTGLEAGSDLGVVVLKGDLVVRCNDGGHLDIGEAQCYEEVLKEGSHSKFVTEEKAEAKYVTLTSTWENGKVVSKKKNFDPETGKSKKTFNLWIASLLQVPLLDYGINQIEYRLHNGDEKEAIRRGQFDVTVSKIEERTCPDGFVYSTNENDCRFAGSLCQRYFRQYNNCRD